MSNMQTSPKCKMFASKLKEKILLMSAVANASTTGFKIHQAGMKTCKYREGMNEFEMHTHFCCNAFLCFGLSGLRFTACGRR